MDDYLFQLLALITLRFAYYDRHYLILVLRLQLIPSIVLDQVQLIQIDPLDHANLASQNQRQHSAPA